MSSDLRLVPTNTGYQNGDITAPPQESGAAATGLALETMQEQSTAPPRRPTTESYAPLPTTTLNSSPISSPVAASSTAATSSPTSSPAPTHHGLPPLTIKIIAIVVPIVAVALLIPLIYLLYRSHRMRKETEKQSSQRNSREAMIAKESIEPKNTSGAPPPPRPQRSPTTTPRPANSMGLFNFDLSPTSPNGEQTPARFSIARSLQLRRSQASVVNQDRTNQNRTTGPNPNPPQNNPATANRDSSTIVYTQQSPPPSNPPTATESHFAPLNMIGTAVSHPTRPKPNRNPSGGNAVPQSAIQSSKRKPSSSNKPQPPLPTAPSPAVENTDPPAPNNRTVNPPVSAYNVSDYHDSLLPPAPSSSARPTTPQQSRPVSPLNSTSTEFRTPSFGLGMGGRFTLTDYSAENNGDGNHPNTSGGTTTGGAGTTRPLPRLDTNTNNHNNYERRSDVSGLSVDPDWLSQEERDRRGGGRTSTESHEVVSPADDHESMNGSRRRDLR